MVPLLLNLCGSLGTPAGRQQKALYEGKTKLIFYLNSTFVQKYTEKTNLTVPLNVIHVVFKTT